MQILDITTPATPILVGSYGEKNTVDIEIDGGVAYLSNESDGISILDISDIFTIDAGDIFTPTLLKQYSENLSSQEITLQEKILYVADNNNGLHTIDVSSPLTPTHQGHFPYFGDASGTVAKDGHYLYVGDSGGMIVVDMQDPNEPVVVAHESSLDSVNDIYIQGDLIYLARYGGLTIVSKEIPSKLQVLGGYSIGNALRVYVLDQVAYVASSEQGLQIVDVSDPSHPSLLRTYDALKSANGIWVADDIAYISSETDGLEIIDVQDPSQPKRLGGYDVLGETGEEAKDVEVVGTIAYIVAFREAIVAVDVQDPSSPVFLDSYRTHNYALSLTIDGEFAYIASGWDGVVVVDISDPENLTLAGECHLSFTKEIAVDDDLVYATDDGGLQILHQRIDHYTIKGKVLDEDGNPLPNVQISAGNGISPVKTTSDGSYVLQNLPKREYTLKAELDGYSFSPASRTIQVPPDSHGKNFTASPTIIAGQILDTDSNPLKDVRIVASNGTDTRETTTNSEGNYGLSNILAGTYTLTPTLEGFTFDPPSLTVTVPPSKKAQDFTALPMTYMVRGKVSDESANALKGVVITVSDGQYTTTDHNGVYTLTNMVAGTYTLTPTREAFIFDPPSLTITVPPSKTEQDFTATPIALYNQWNDQG